MVEPGRFRYSTLATRYASVCACLSIVNRKPYRINPSRPSTSVRHIHPVKVFNNGDNKTVPRRSVDQCCCCHSTLLHFLFLALGPGIDILTAITYKLHQIIHEHIRQPYEYITIASSRYHFDKISPLYLILSQSNPSSTSILRNMHLKTSMTGFLLNYTQ